MKRVLLGTLLCLVILVVALVLASRWPALFWLSALALLLYFAFGRQAQVEFRLGVGGLSGERKPTWRLYGSGNKQRQREA